MIVHDPSVFDGLADWWARWRHRQQAATPLQPPLQHVPEPVAPHALGAAPSACPRNTAPSRDHVIIVTPDADYDPAWERWDE